MTDKRAYILQPLPHPSRQRAKDAIDAAPDGHSVSIREATRSLAQNSAQWPYLEAFSKQLLWPVNGAMVQMTPEEFKDVLTAAFQKETVRLAMGLDGGVVMLGLRTSKLGKKRFSEYLEFLKATAALRGVKVYQDEEQNDR